MPMMPNWLKRLKAPLRSKPRAAVRRSESIGSVNEAGLTFHYQLKRSSARRTLALQVRETADIVVQAPQQTPLSTVEGFVLQHLPWLRERLKAVAQQHSPWDNGMTLPWLGQSLTLDWHENGPIVPRMDGNRLQLAGPWVEVPGRVQDWYFDQAVKLLPARLKVHAARMGVVAPPLRVSAARTRWGSLSAQGRMGLNGRLVMLSEDLIDYVICHELAHLRQHNHSPAFWREVEALYPDYRLARIRLRREGRAAMALAFEAVGEGRGVPDP